MAGNREDFPKEEVEVHASMKIVRKESGQTSNGSDRQFVIASKQPDTVRIDIRVEDEAKPTGSSCSSMEERFKSVMINPEDSKRSQLSESKWPRIPKVPQMLRGSKDFKKRFEPRVFSVGPYHHHKPQLKPAEMLKRQLTKHFIQDSGQGIEVLYKKIEREIPDLRNCYKNSAIKKYSNEDLAWMMLVDGCSLLHYIHCFTTGGEMKDCPPNKDQNAVFIQQDLFLLENQLPFRVLELLLESRFKEDERMKLIENFIQMTGLPVRKPDKKPEKKEEKPSHLLDLLRRRLLGDKRGNKREDGKGWNSFRNVNELKAAGITFKPNNSGSLRDISFNSYLFHGVLKLPEIIIDDSSESRFLNLIAYEMSSEVPIDSEVTSYICFLDSLIDYPEDVKELRRRGVLRNFLGSDEEVATLFNEITTDLVLDFDAYEGVKHQIQRHYNNRVSTWMTEGLHNHFGSPWTFLAFVGALLALFLSAVQTWCTVFPPGT